jgi:tight adherence protein C
MHALDSSLIPALIPALLFGAVVSIVFVAGQYVSAYSRVNRRLSTAPSDLAGDQPFAPWRRFVVRYFAETRFGVADAQREKLRRELLKAGYFSPYAVNYYIGARLGSVLVLPSVIFILLSLAPVKIFPLAEIILVAVTTMIAIVVPDAYVSRRQRALARRYRQVFPDLLDLLIICVDAGLAIEAAFNRVSPEIAKQCRELGSNLEIMGAEMRAGRSTIEALASFAARLGLDEAGSFATMLRQSLELGSDIGESLRVFSEEMRDRRLLLAEEAANKLSVKIVLPLGLFIFPVILLVIMLPVIIKLMSILR